MAAIGVLPNEKSTTITSSGGNVITIDYPVIAIAYGYCTIKFSSSVLLAGAKLNVALSSNHSIDVTLDSTGRAQFSLLPFIRVNMETDGVQSLPLESTGNNTKEINVMRGAFSLDITDYATNNTTSITVYYIFGNNCLLYDTDKYINFNTGDTLGTWTTLDFFAGNDADGVPTDVDVWCECNFNLNRYLNDPQDVEQFEVSFYRGGDIVNAVVDYHLIEDCRVDGVRAVKWLDSSGGINIRKLTATTEQHSAAASSSYQRPHTDLNIANSGYYHGDDKWELMTPTTTITLGDDAIPMCLYDWLKELATSPVVELWSGAVNGAGKWLRCNLVNTSIERDTRKATFSLTVQLQVPTYKGQEF